MLDLPSEADLKELYYRQGHDALIWYSWRCALRTVPMLGLIPLKNNWHNKTSQNIFILIRLLFILAQWKKSPYEAQSILFKITPQLNRKSFNASIVSKVIIETASVASMNVFSSKSFRVVSPVPAAYSTSRLAINTFSDKAFIKDFIESATSDFEYLKSTPDWQWLNYPLWFKKISGLEKQRLFDQTLNILLTDIAELNLDFLSNDLHALLHGKPLGKHVANYLEDLSTSILTDPYALRKAILSQEKIQRIKAVRVLLLGSGGAGKTSLAKRLKGEKEFTTYQAATTGVDYQQHQALKLHETLPELNLATNDLDLYLWDFGGQTIFHGLHSAFLHENCVYVLVVDNRHEQAPEEWLYQIRHLAGSQAKVLLVTNEYENCYARQN